MYTDKMLKLAVDLFSQIILNIETHYYLYSQLYLGLYLSS